MPYMLHTIGGSDNSWITPSYPWMQGLSMDMMKFGGSFVAILGMINIVLPEDQESME